MKRIIKLTSLIITIFIINLSMAQTPPPPNNGNSGGVGGLTPVGGGAPIGGGVVILIAMGLAYAYAKHYLKKPDYTVEEES
jgi:hypothetical protein